VIPSYHAVMTTTGVNFQDNDSWYHMRTVHNIAAHFPHQSGFDPYAILPGRQTSHTEPWDVFIAAIAWVLGFGKPSDWLIDQVGAWLPAILGALLPIPLYFLARRLFGESAARWTAIATAGVPGALVWTSHLGVPDHHVAECLLSVCALVALRAAVESTGSQRLWRTAVCGLPFGIYLCVRPAGIFVPATLTPAALFEPLLAPFVAASMAIAATVFLTSSGSLWASYTWPAPVRSPNIPSAIIVGMRRLPIRSPCTLRHRSAFVQSRTSSCHAKSLCVRAMQQRKNFIISCRAGLLSAGRESARRTRCALNPVHHARPLFSAPTSETSSAQRRISTLCSCCWGSDAQKAVMLEPHEQLRPKYVSFLPL